MLHGLQPGALQAPAARCLPRPLTAYLGCAQGSNGQGQIGKGSWTADQNNNTFTPTAVDTLTNAVSGRARGPSSGTPAPRAAAVRRSGAAVGGAAHLAPCAVPCSAPCGLQDASCSGTARAEPPPMPACQRPPASDRPPPPAPPQIAITAGPFHTCATTADSKLWCWGQNTGAFPSV